MRVLFLSAAAGLSLLPAALAAQTGGPGAGPSVPNGAPGQNPYAHPDGIDARDLSMSAAARTALDNKAADARAAMLARSKYGRAVPATASDVVAQATVYDLAGETVGTIEAVDPDGVVVATAVGKVKVPANAFGKNRQGLLVGVAKKDFEAQVMKANASPTG